MLYTIYRGIALAANAAQLVQSLRAFPGYMKEAFFPGKTKKIPKQLDGGTFNLTSKRKLSPAQRANHYSKAGISILELGVWTTDLYLLAQGEFGALTPAFFGTAYALYKCSQDANHVVDKLASQSGKKKPARI